jgi:hypothetical protein
MIYRSIILTNINVEFISIFVGFISKPIGSIIKPIEYISILNIFNIIKAIDIIVVKAARASSL